MKISQNEPALVTGAVTAVLTAVAGCGVTWLTSDNIGYIAGAVSAVLAMVGALATRQQVTPNSTVNTLVASVAPEAAMPLSEHEVFTVQPDGADVAAVSKPAALDLHIQRIPSTDARLGRHVEHDERSRDYAVSTTGTVRPKTWRHYGAVLDQGQLGSCTGNAMAQALNTTPLRVKGRTLTEDDALKLYEAATRLDSVPGQYPPTDTGSSGLAVAKAAVQAGYITSYRHAFGLDQLVAGLQNGPAIVGTVWLDDMFNPDLKGFVHPGGDVAGGHEYLCLGVDPDRKVLTFLNSWGTTWGDAGRFHMTFADFNALLADQGDAVFPVR